jgi:deferrochelatase/peroxidase EfeB
MSDSGGTSVGLSRRRLLGLLGAAGGGVALGAGGYLLSNEGGESPASAGTRIEPFYGENQPGIATTPQQVHLRFSSFDLGVTSAAGLRDLMRAWSSRAAALMAGTVAGIDDPARLTVTLGLGPSVFGDAVSDRFGLAGQRPAPLDDLPAFSGDRLQPALTGGDVCIQVCSDDKVVASLAARALEREAAGAASVRWTQDGFLRAPLPGDTGPTRRNLIGFKDGTNNLHPTDGRRMRENVWAGSAESPHWMSGGTYLVVRRIAIQVEEFLTEPVDEQERTIGRKKASGAPFGQSTEFAPVIPGKELPDSHIMMANQRKSSSERERILRRGYNYTTGFDDEISSPLGGLFFIAYQQDPRRQFSAIQERLSRLDRLTKYIVHQGSGLFAIPPGASSGGYVGETLLASV